MATALWELAGVEDDRLFSPYCWRIRMALLHKGLAFESLPWRFTDQAALSFSGQGRVPVLVDGSRCVHDSWDIAVYLDEHYNGRPALFECSQARSLALFVKHWCETQVHPATLRVIIGDLFDAVHPRDKAYFRQTREQRLGERLETLSQQSHSALPLFRASLDPVRPVLVAQDFLGGKGPSFADYILFGPFQWARAVSPTRLLDPDDPIYAWRERMLDRFGGAARQMRGYPVWA